MSRKLEDLTEFELLEFLTKIQFSDYETNKEADEAIEEFLRLVEHPSGTDLLFYPDPQEPHTPQTVLEKIKAWRAENGKTSFKLPQK